MATGQQLGILLGMSPQTSPSRDQDKFMLRMPDGMRDQIAEVAKANNRSMNAEIIARLEASLDTDHETGTADLHDLAAELKRQLERLQQVTDTVAGLNGMTADALLRDTAPKRPRKPR